MYFFLKRCALTVTLVIAALIMSSCDQSSAFDTDYEAYLSSPDDGEEVSGDVEFTYEVYASKYIIVAIFSDYPSVDSGNKVTNWEDCIGGIHTNMPGFSRGVTSLSHLHPYSPEDSDFSTEGSVTLTIGQKYYWLVWGLDEKLRIVESSPIYDFIYVDEQQPQE